MLLYLCRGSGVFFLNTWSDPPLTAYCLASVLFQDCRRLGKCPTRRASQGECRPYHRRLLLTADWCAIRTAPGSFERHRTSRHPGHRRPNAPTARRARGESLSPAKVPLGPIRSTETFASPLHSAPAFQVSLIADTPNTRVSPNMRIPGRRLYAYTYGPPRFRWTRVVLKR
jgi:hypothetical protein